MAETRTSPMADAPEAARRAALAAASRSSRVSRRASARTAIARAAARARRRRRHLDRLHARAGRVTEGVELHRGARLLARARRARSAAPAARALVFESDTLARRDAPPARVRSTTRRPRAGADTRSPRSTCPGRRSSRPRRDRAQRRHRHRARRRPGPPHGRRRQGPGRSARHSRWSRTSSRASAPQVGELLVNANQNARALRALGHPRVADEIGGFAGPLAGLHAGLVADDDAAASVTVPCDSPFLPRDLVARLRAAPGARRARSSRSPRPATRRTRCSPRARDVRDISRAFLAGGGTQDRCWYATLRVVEVPFDDEADAFLNINTRDELAAAAPPA